MSTSNFYGEIRKNQNFWLKKKKQKKNLIWSYAFTESKMFFHCEIFLYLSLKICSDRYFRFIIISANCFSETLRQQFTVLASIHTV